MYKEVFIRDFSSLGTTIDNFLQGVVNNTLLNRAFDNSLKLNPLFTIFMQTEALRAICKKFLNRDCLNNWLAPYGKQLTEKEITVGIIMAGNLPLVGFHDFLVVMASGCRAEIKLSGKDKNLLPALFKILCRINPYWRKRVIFIENLPEKIDLLLATGSEESSKLFESKYKEVPKIVRGSRSSIAILNRDETVDELRKLSDDIFLYFGMGCRSVSTLLVPAGYNCNSLIEIFSEREQMMKNEEYLGAYKYQKAIAIMHNSWYIDGGFYILREYPDFPPPMGVISVLTYKNAGQIDSFLDSNKSHLQCVVSRASTKFGEAQYPPVDEYADGINSLEFLLNNI